MHRWKDGDSLSFDSHLRVKGYAGRNLEQFLSASDMSVEEANFLRHVRTDQHSSVHELPACIVGQALLNTRAEFNEEEWKWLQTWMEEAVGIDALR